MYLYNHLARRLFSSGDEVSALVVVVLTGSCRLTLSSTGQIIWKPRVVTDGTFAYTTHFGELNPPGRAPRGADGLPESN